MYDADVDPANARAIAILERCRESPREMGPVRLSEAYLRAVERLEALPENLPSADKTWVERSRREFREYFARVRPAPSAP